MATRKNTYRMPLTELRAYRLIRPRLEMIVRRFHASHGGDLEDMQGEAVLKFLELYRKGEYDRTKGSFEYYIEYYVRKMLLESLRTRLGRNNRLPRVEEDLDSRGREDSMFYVDLACADPDVQQVVGVVLNTPRLVNSKTKKQNHEQYIEGFIQRQFPHWRPSRVRSSIRTIRRML